jgi:hypothetical protein
MEVAVEETLVEASLLCVAFICVCAALIASDGSHIWAGLRMRKPLRDP